MVRTPLTPEERERGLALGRALRRARGDRSASEVALAALARVLDLDLAALAEGLTDRQAA